MQLIIAESCSSSYARLVVLSDFLLIFYCSQAVILGSDQTALAQSDLNLHWLKHSLM